MFSTQPHRILLAWLILVLAITACTSQAQATGTPTNPPSTNTPLPSPTLTNTPKPTSTPRPSATPNTVATEKYDKMFSLVQKFDEDGLLSSTNGRYKIMPDYEEDFAQIGWLQFNYLPGTMKHFIFNANVKWQTAMDTTDTSGCGIVFGVEEQGKNYEYYGVVLDKSRIYFSIARSGYYRELGKTRGTGRLEFGNPAEAELTLLVYNNHAFVYVDDNFIGEYTLSESKELRGNFGYGIISGTNKGYGTRCQISNATMWQFTQ